VASSFHCLDLSELYNNCGVTSFEEKEQGMLNGAGASFPAELVPLGYAFEFEGIPFIMTKHNGLDNIEVEGQRLVFSPMYVSRIHILGLSNDSHMSEEIQLEYDGEIVSSKLMRLSSYSSANPYFGNKCLLRSPYVHFHNQRTENYQPAIWYDSIEIDPSTAVNAILLADNPCIHIFSITVEAEEAIHGSLERRTE
jgi:hypothetical protein